VAGFFTRAASELEIQQGA